MVWLMILALLGAEPDEARVRVLVGRLGSESFVERQAAQARLAAYGEAIVPVLRRIKSPDPEVRRLVRGLTATSRRLRLSFEIAGVPTLAKPLRFRVRVANDTDYSYRLPLVQPRDGGLRSAISLLVFREGEAQPTTTPIRVDALEKITPPLENNAGVLLRPGEAMLLEFALKATASPLRRPGRTKLGAIYEGQGAMVWYGYRQRTDMQGEITAVAVRSPPLTVQTVGRTPKQIAAAMDGRDPFVRDEAIAELLLRDDDAMLPILRKHAKGPEAALMLAAVRRLGAHGADEDFALIYATTRHEGEVLRRAAVGALANYPRRRARARLISLAQDHELKDEALRALRKHKHYSTIDCFVRLLRAGTASREHSRLMRDTLFEWTDRIVDNRESEIRAFERWWSDNRTAWRKANGG